MYGFFTLLDFKAVADIEDHPCKSRSDFDVPDCLVIFDGSPAHDVIGLGVMCQHDGGRMVH